MQGKKTLLKFLLSPLTVLILVFAAASVCYAAEKVLFTDSGFESAVREALDMPSGDIAGDALKTLYADIKDEAIRSLLFYSGVDLFEYNRILCISNGQIVRNGKEIDESGDENLYVPLSLEDILMFEDIQLLYISGADIADLSPLAELSELVCLNISDSMLYDTASLEEMTGLLTLEITDCIIEDIDTEKLEKSLPDTRFTYTDRFVRFVSPDFEQMVRRALKKETGEITKDELSTLYIEEDGDTYLPILFGHIIKEESDMERIEADLSIFGGDINLIPEENFPRMDMSDLVLFDDVSIIALGGMNIEGLPSTESFDNLYMLVISYCLADSINPLFDAPNLNTVLMESFKISDPEQGFNPSANENITRLEITDTNIADFSSLGGMTALKYLDLNNNNISDAGTLEFVKNLEGLQYLDIEWNYVPYSGAEAIEGMLNEDVMYFYYDMYIRFSDKAFSEMVAKALDAEEREIYWYELYELYADEQFLDGLLGEDIGSSNCLNIYLGYIVRDWDEFEEVLYASSESWGIDEDGNYILPKVEISLADLSLFPDIDGAAFYSVDIDDFSPIADLGLSYLHVESSKVTDLNPLFAIPDLDRLYIFDSEPDVPLYIKAPKNSSLKALILGMMDITDLSPLYGFTGLEYVDLNYLPVTMEDVKKLQAALPDAVIVTDGIEEEPLVFSDELFETLVLEALGREQGSITESDLKSLYADEDLTSDGGEQLSNTDKALFIANGKIIRSLEEFEAVITDMEYNAPDDISSILPLDDIALFPGVEGVYIFQSGIGDVTPLSNIPTLKDVVIMQSVFDDISPLFASKSIKTLAVSALYPSEEIVVFPNKIMGSNIKNLILSNLGITDITPLKDIPELVYLDLSSNSITNISTLKNLPGLTELDLTGNLITDITPLLGLKSLEWITVGENYLSDDEMNLLIKNFPDDYVSGGNMYVSFADEAFEATAQRAAGNPGRNIYSHELVSFYCDTDDEMFTDLTEYQELDGYEIDYMLMIVGDEIVRNYAELNAAIEKFENGFNVPVELNLENILLFPWVDYLFLYGCKISDVTCLSELPNLVAVNATSCDISDAAMFYDLPHLESLLLESSTITYDVPRYVPKTKASSLKWFFCYSMLGMEHLFQFKTLANLEFLAMIYCELADITPMADLESLEDLVLEGNYISSVKPLASLKNLIYLDLSDNIIDDYAPLQGIESLETLLLDYNNIADISFLAEMTQLIQLSLYVNEIADIKPLLGLKSLMYLDIEENNVTDKSFDMLRKALPDCKIYWN